MASNQLQSDPFAGLQRADDPFGGLKRDTFADLPQQTPAQQQEITARQLIDITENPFSKAVEAVSEPITNMVTEFASQLPKGLGALALINNPAKTDEWMAAVEKYTVVQPTSSSAHLTTTIANLPFEYAGKALNWVGEKMGQITEAQWSPVVNNLPGISPTAKREVLRQLGGISDGLFQAGVNYYLLKGISGKIGAPKPEISEPSVVPEKLAQTPEQIHETTITAAQSSMLRYWDNMSKAEKEYATTGTKPSQIIDDLVETHEGNLAVARRHMERMAKAMTELVPDKERRTVVGDYLEGEKAALSPNERLMADNLRKFYDQALDVGRKAGVLNAALDDYITHATIPGTPRNMLESLRDALSNPQDRLGMSFLSRKTPFARERTIRLSLKEIREDPRFAGIRFEQDPVRGATIYGQSVTRAIHNSRLLAALKEATDETGEKLMRPIAEGESKPRHYGMVNHVQVAGHWVHNEVIPAMKFIFSEPAGEIIRGLNAITNINKRMRVGFSLFHARALADAAAEAGINPFKISHFADKYWRGEAGDVVDQMLQDGVKLSRSVEDITGDYFYSSMRGLAGVMDRSIGEHMGGPVRAIVAGSEYMDRFLWDWLQRGYKIQTYLAKVEKGFLDHPEISPRDIRRAAADFTNATFGGLNWYQLASSFTHPKLRAWAMELFSPQGRRVMQLLAFAPDWSISTTLSFLRAIPGWAKNKYLKQLHQAYVGRAFVYYMAVGNALNMSFTGKPIWDNKDPTMVDISDTQHIRISKHSTEPLEWFFAPRKQALGKMAFLPSTALEFLQGLEWLPAAGHKAPPIKDLPAWTLEKFAPFPVVSGIQGGWGDFLSSLFGSPIYGQTPEAVAARKAAEKLAREKKKLEDPQAEFQKEYEKALRSMK